MNIPNYYTISLYITIVLPPAAMYCILVIKYDQISHFFVVISMIMMAAATSPWVQRHHISIYQPYHNFTHYPHLLHFRQ